MKYRWIVSLCAVAIAVGLGCPDGTEEPEQNAGISDAGIDEDAGGDDIGDGDEPVAAKFAFPTQEFVIEEASPERPEAEVLDDAGEVIEDARIRWSSEDPSIIEITSGGQALGHELGETELVASHEELEATWPARVVGARVAEVDLVPADATVVVGWELPYMVNLYDLTNAPIEDERAIAWSTTDESVASIDGDGVVEAHAAGDIEVVATVEGIEDRADLTVLDAEVESIAILPAAPASIYRGDTLQLDVQAYDLEDEPIGTPVAQWSSSAPSVASVDDTGLVEGVDTGEAVISAVVGELEASVDVEVIFTVRALGAGGDFSCAVVGNELHCWGANDDGQLGDGTFEERMEPVVADFDHEIEAVSLGGAHGCLVDGDGQIWCWGANGSGQLGRPAGAAEATPRPVPTGVEFRDVAAGGEHTCGVTTGDQVYCWGENGDHQLGHSQSSTHEPTAVGGPTGFEDVVAGDAHTCAIGTDESGYCWGDNRRDQLGGGVSAERSAEPTEVVGGYSFNSLSAGAQFTCGTAAGGPPVCWGANDRGQLGNGNTADQDVPLTLDMEAGEGFTAIETGDEHACGLVSGGSPRCWGAADDGRLGRDTADDATSPQPTDGEEVFSRIAAGGGHTCGRTPDHEVFCWGAAPAQGASFVEIDL